MPNGFDDEEEWTGVRCLICGKMNAFNPEAIDGICLSHLEAESSDEPPSQGGGR